MNVPAALESLEATSDEIPTLHAMSPIEDDDEPTRLAMDTEPEITQRILVRKIRPLLPVWLTAAPPPCPVSAQPRRHPTAEVLGLHALVFIFSTLLAGTLVAAAAASATSGVDETASGPRTPVRTVSVAAKGAPARPSPSGASRPAQPAP